MQYFVTCPIVPPLSILPQSLSGNPVHCEAFRRCLQEINPPLSPAVLSMSVAHFPPTVSFYAVGDSCAITAPEWQTTEVTVTRRVRYSRP